MDQLPAIQVALEGYAKKDVDWFIGELPKMADDLLDQKDDVLDPIFTFMEGPQRQIYEQANQFLKDNQNNFSHAGADKAKALKAILIDEGCFKGNRMQEAKGLLHDLRLQIDQGLMEARATANEKLETLQANMRQLSEYQTADGSHQARADQAFETIRQEIQNQRIIALIQVSVDRFTADQYPSVLGGLTPPVSTPPSGDGGTPAPAPKPAFVSAKSVSVAASKSVLDTEEDVDAYLKALREALVQQIKDGKRITV